MAEDPGVHVAAHAMARSHLRASDTDREQVIDSLKDAFAQGRLSLDELVMRAARALRSRTYAELATITADIPAVLIRNHPEPVRAPTRKAINTRAVAWTAGVIIALPSLWAVFLTYYGGFIVLVLLGFVVSALVPTTERNPSGPW